MFDFEALIFSIFYEDPLSGLLTLIEIAAVVLLIIRIFQRRKEAKKQEQQNKNLMMAKLTNSLSNPLWLEREGKPDMQLLPLETKWKEAVTESTDGIRLDLEVRNANVSMKYTFIMEDSITIGKGENCSITITEEGIEDRHLELFIQDGVLMVKKLSPFSMAILERERDYKKLGEEAVRVMDKDIIRLGSSELIIDLIRQR